MKLKINTLLFLCVLLAFILRFAGLESLSPPLNRDEAALGYNAYSLLETGKDEHGEPWPFSFKSIGDYKMPGYIYLSMVPIKLLGLTVFATRFWSALSGVVAVVALWLLAKELAFLLPKKLQTTLPFIASLLLAINPWHIHYSRIGFEANVNLSLFLWALLLTFWGIKKNKWWIGGSLLFVAMQFMYSSTFVFLPLFAAVSFILLVLLIKPKIQSWFYVSLSLVLLLIGSTIAVKNVADVSKAKQSITVFSDPTTIDTFNHQRGYWQAKSLFVAKIWFNKYTYFGRIIASNYLRNFSPGFLFFNHVSHPWHTVPRQGFFYALDGIFFILGFIVLATAYKKVSIKNRGLLLIFVSWLLLSPAASAITVDAPHATRSLYLIPIFVLFSSSGILLLVDIVKQKRRMVAAFILCLYVVSFVRFAYLYLIVFPLHYDMSLFPRIEKVVSYLEAKDDTKTICFTEVSSSPYLYVLFYGKVNPELIQEEAQWKAPDTVGLTNIEKFGKYRFTEGNCSRADYVVLRGKSTETAEIEFKYPKVGVEWSVIAN